MLPFAEGTDTPSLQSDRDSISFVSDGPTLEARLEAC